MTAGRTSGVARPALLAGLLFLLVVGPWVKPLTAQPASRVALTAAMVDHSTIRLDRYEDVLGIDRVERDGHLYSDKAPGQPMLAAPFYALARAIGADPADELRVDGNLTLWWVTLWSSAIPGALLVALMCRLAWGSERSLAVVGGVVVGFGTLLLPFSAELYGHVLATALGMFAWALLRPDTPSTRRVALAGGLAGLAVLVEYQMALLVAILVVHLVVRHGVRRLVPFSLAGLPFAAVLLAYQALAFGRVLSTSYSEKPVHAGAGAAVAGVPSPHQAVEVLFGARGLIVFAPIVLLGLLGLVRLARKTGAERADGLVGLAAFAAYLALQAGWPNPWGGEMPGPRYLIPALPFLAVGVAQVWREAGRARVLVAAWSVVAMSLPLVTLHLVVDGGITVVQHLRNIDQFGVSPTVWTVAAGPVGWFLHGATAAGAAWLLWRAVGVLESPEPVADA